MYWLQTLHHTVPWADNDQSPCSVLHRCFKSACARTDSHTHTHTHMDPSTGIPWIRVYRASSAPKASPWLEAICPAELSKCVMRNWSQIESSIEFTSRFSSPIVEREWGGLGECRLYYSFILTIFALNIDSKTCLALWGAKGRYQRRFIPAPPPCPPPSPF